MRRLFVTLAVLLALAVPALAEGPDIVPTQLARETQSNLGLTGYAYDYQDVTYDPRLDAVPDGRIDVQDIQAVASRWHSQADASAHGRIRVTDYWIVEDPDGDRFSVLGYIENGTPLRLESTTVAARFFDAQGQLLASADRYSSPTPPPFGRSLFAVYFYIPLPGYDHMEVVLTDVDAYHEPVRFTVVSTTPDGNWLNLSVRNDTGYPVKYPSLTFWLLDAQGRPYEGWWTSVNIIDGENDVMQPGEIGTTSVRGASLSDVYIQWSGQIYLASHLN